MSTSTINQIIKQIDSFASAHRQINSFGVGRIYDFAASGDTKYPSLWVDYGNTSVNNVNMGGSEYTTSIRVYIVDRLMKGATNETEVVSDTQQTALDLISYLSNSYVFTWLIDSSIQLTVVGDPSQDDEVAGYYFDLNFRQAFEKDRCAIPFTSNPSPSGAADYHVTIYDQDGNVITTVQPMSSYTVTLVSGINGGTASSTYSNNIVGGLSI